MNRPCASFTQQLVVFLKAMVFSRRNCLATEGVLLKCLIAWTARFICLSSIPCQAAVRIISPSGYLPGTPFLVRIDVLDASNAVDRDLWNTNAILQANNPEITLPTNRLTLRNGSGSVLITIAGASDFVLTTQANGETSSKLIRNRASEPVISVGGTLQGNTPKWSGMLHITDIRRFRRRTFDKYTSLRRKRMEILRQRNGSWGCMVFA